MAIYSKTGKIWSNDYKFSRVETLNKVDLSSNDVTYYHHPYDNLFHKVSFVDAVNPENFEHIRNNPTVTLVHENSCEAIDSRFAEEVFQAITKHNINPSQIKIIAADENHKNFLKEYLENKNVHGTDISVQNTLLSKVKIPPSNLNESTVRNKKFSSLSRNYKEWRLFLYEELFRNDLLKHFTYSFHNIWPYGDVEKVFTVSQMVEDLSNLGVKDLSKDFIKWLARSPHDLDISEGDNVKNKWSNVTYDAIRSADFHLTVETHFDQKSFTGQDTFDRSFGPSSITEKAYKPISCSRPFIIFSTPYFLEDTRKLGYKTFEPYINESYDLETNNHKRLQMIVEEVDRICNLPKEEYDVLVKNCMEIAMFNYERLKEHKRAYKDAT